MGHNILSKNPIPYFPHHKIQYCIVSQFFKFKIATEKHNFYKFPLVTMNIQPIENPEKITPQRYKATEDTKSRC